jgi:oxygen-independent coproporphyrinogen III oxidase
METDRAVYIHIPFCVSKCHYCDFNSYPGMGDIFDAYAAAVRKEISSTVDRECCAATLYIGGGTPTVMSDQQIMSMVEAVRTALYLPKTAEATIEANPATADGAKLDALMTSGLNRISFGVQSFEDSLLRGMGRPHSSADSLQAVIDARLSGFHNISIDLIYALPGQSTDTWRDTLRQAINLAPEHVSLYELTIENGTPFAQWFAQGKLSLPDEEDQIEMYAAAESALEAEGYEHYEISNFTKPGSRCEHNQFYWRNDEYYGFGAGAVSYIRGKRTRNVSSPSEYVQRVQDTGSAVDFAEELSVEGQMGETVMLGLRMTEGLDMDRFRERYGVDLQSVYSTELARFLEQGLIQMCGSHLRLTHRGTLLSNEVMAEFIRSEQAVPA